MVRSPMITHIVILVFKSNYKDKDRTTSKRLFLDLINYFKLFHRLEVVIFDFLSRISIIPMKKARNSSLPIKQRLFYCTDLIRNTYYPCFSACWRNRS